MKKKKPLTWGCLVLILGIFFLWLFIQVLFFFVNNIRYQPQRVTSRQEFFQEYAPLAQKIGKKYHLYPSVILAQAALESNFGQSDLARVNKNFFGIKAKKGQGVSYATEEVENGQRVTIKDNFESYKSPVDSFKHYGRLLSQAQRYQPVREAKSAQEACHKLHPSGYSTDPGYGQRLVDLIKQYNLEVYDQGIKDSK